MKYSKSRRWLLPLLVCLCTLLTDCGSSHGQMLQVLSELEEANRADSVMRNDSLAEALVAYFDSHGTPNERMRSRYILGRTYYDLGELPRALETYLKAAECADTTKDNCDYKVLSRIHAQSANVFHRQIQPRSELREWKLAEYYAWKGLDTLMAIECYSQTSAAYQYLKQFDSVIVVKENAAQLLSKIGQHKLSIRKLMGTITPLLRIRDTIKAKRYIHLFDTQSELFDEEGNIQKGREIYYYIKGKYYLAINKADSAEIMFRKELRLGHDLNNQIAGCKGLQEVYAHRAVADSIAKYASLGYELNDSAYSLSEMQNLQVLQASYNYSHNKLLAEQNARRAENATTVVVVIVAIFIIILLICLFLFSEFNRQKELQLQQYQHTLENLSRAQDELLELRKEKQISSQLIEKKNKEIILLQEKMLDFQSKMEHERQLQFEEKLKTADIIRTLKEHANSNPPLKATTGELQRLKSFVNSEIPSFYSEINTDKYTPTPLEYNICVLIRTYFSPSEIYKLLGISDGYVSNARSRLLKRVFNLNGTPKDFDQRIREIK